MTSTRTTIVRMLKRMSFRQRREVGPSDMMAALLGSGGSLLHALR
jgi:hypothetical protein